MRVRLVEAGISKPRTVHCVDDLVHVDDLVPGRRGPQ